MANQLAEEFGRGLYRLRNHLGQSRDQVVSRNDISLNALSSIENGQALIKLSTLTDLLNYYGMSLESFIAQYLNSKLNSSLIDLITTESSDDTRFFIFDTKGAVDENNYRDQDFVAYHWNRRQFNRVRNGDWFIYRRPTRGSKQWYFFGIGQIGEIREESNGDMFATIKNSYPFHYYLLAEELEHFTWTFKERRQNNWGHFFNQYGMTHINQADFLHLVDLATTKDPTVSSVTNMVNESGAIYQIIRNFSTTETTRVSTEVMRNGQSILAEVVKADYNFRCAMTGIHTRPFLVASHIIPWKDNIERRLDPTNVICLSSLWDRAFDQGYVTFSPIDHTVRYSSKLDEDTQLKVALQNSGGQKLAVPNRFLPDTTALEYHNDKIFKP